MRRKIDFATIVYNENEEKEKSFVLFE